MKDINGSSPPTSKLIRAKTIPYVSRQYDPQLSERDSIFATSYALDADPSTPISSPIQARAIAARIGRGQVVEAATGQKGANNGRAEGQERKYRHRLYYEEGEEAQRGQGVAMAMSPVRNNLDGFALEFGAHLDSPSNASVSASVPVSTSATAALPHYPKFDKTPIKQLSNRSGLSSQHHQHHHNNHSQHHHHRQHDQQISAPPPSGPESHPVANDRQAHVTADNTINDSTKKSRPTTPLNVNQPPFDALQSSAERKSYRSWREGKGKMKGKTIAESQRATKEAEHVERKIDAKMPKPEQGQNVRSRKTSHYLGLFKNNEQESKKAEDKLKDKTSDLASVTEVRDDSVIGGMFDLLCSVLFSRHIDVVSFGRPTSPA